MKRTHEMRLLASSQTKADSKSKQSNVIVKHQTIETINIRPQAYAMHCRDQVGRVCLCASRVRTRTAMREKNETRRGKNPSAA